MEAEPQNVGGLVAALAVARVAFPTIQKGRTAKVKMKSGGEYSYSYADLSDILDAVSTPLNEASLVVAQTMEMRGESWFLVTKLMHVSGEALESVYPIPHPAENSPQEIGSAITYARRYALTAILGIAAEEDDDGAGGAGVKTPRPKPRAQAQSTPPAATRPSEPATDPNRPPWFGSNVGMGKKLLKIDGQDRKVSELTWGEMASGSEKGGRHSWLRDTLDWANGLDEKSQTILTFIERASWALEQLEKREPFA